MRSCTGSFAEGEFVGFSMTVPNWENAVGVRSSIGIRIEGAGMEVGILAVLPAQLGAVRLWCRTGEVELAAWDRREVASAHGLVKGR